MRTIKLTIAATETHCEHNGALCGFLEFDNTYPLCRAFGGAYGEVVMDTERAGYRRLAECIAAEEAETHGA